MDSPVGLASRIDEHYVLWLQIGMDETELFQLQQGRQHLNTNQDKHTTRLLLISGKRFKSLDVFNPKGFNGRFSVIMHTKKLV